MDILKNLIVLECSSDLVGATACLRLSELGAKVIRLIDTASGDKLSKKSYFGQFYKDKSILYHSKTRKCSEQYLDSSNKTDREILENLISTSDVIVYNFNDNILSRFDIDINTLKENKILAEYSDYGSHTTCGDKVADELLIQAISGVAHLSGNRDDAPTPIGFDVATRFCASYLIQGINAALYRREVSEGRGSKISTSLLEAVVYIQLEFITTAAHNDMQTPTRTLRGNAHAGLPAPYGVYRSKDGFFAMSMISIPYLASIMGVSIPDQWVERPSWLEYRDEIMAFLSPHFLTKTNSEWMELFTPHDVWCSDIFSISETLELEAYKILEIEKSYPLYGDDTFVSTRLPYHIELSQNKDRVKTKSNYCDKPLDELLVVDISQYLSGPTSTLMLADLGAKVIKIERPQGGDMGRNVIISNMLKNDTSTSYLAVGRNKKSAALDLKVEEDRVKVLEIMTKADVIIQNFRPTVMEKLGLDYNTIKEVNPSVIYAEVSGYGDKGCWKGKPGQDYIVQALSGLCSINGERDSEPVPVGLSVVDLIAGCHIDEAVTAALYNREINGQGAHISVTMFEGVMDLQSDFITAYRWNDKIGDFRSRVSNAHGGEDAPYGIYQTSDSYIAIGAAPIETLLGEKIECDGYVDWSEYQDAIKRKVAARLLTNTTAYWINKLSKLPKARCGEIKNWSELFNSPLGKSLNMLQSVTRGNGYTYTTTRCPLRINDNLLTYTLGAPKVGEHTDYIVNGRL